MRVNIYSQELTSEAKLVIKEGPDGQKFSAVMLMLHSSKMLHQPPQHVADDDDRSAISLWIPRSATRREALAKTFEHMALLVRTAPNEVAEDVKEDSIRVWLNAQLVKVLAVDETKITDDSDLADDLGLDSLDMIQLFMYVEEKYAIEIPDNSCEKLRSVRDIVQYIANHRMV